MIFETKRLYVTKWKPRDLNALHELYNDTAIKEFILPQLTIEETRSIFEDQLNDYSGHFPFGRYFIVEKLSNKFIGLLLFKKDSKKTGVEIGYSLIKNYWKKGYATEIVKESIAWIFESKGFSSMCAITGLYNENSKNVLLKCGFLRKENFTEDGEEMNLFGLLKKDMLLLQ
jgi:[ribosomal protein S5]-alanine N-acetyltransferase